jgi:hypothetical protein
MKLNILVTLALTTILAYGAACSEPQPASAENSASYEKHPYLEINLCLRQKILASN